mgnify:CR=1 FL=1
MSRGKLLGMRQTPTKAFSPDADDVAICKITELHNFTPVVFSLSSSCFFPRGDDSLSPAFASFECSDLDESRKRALVWKSWKMAMLYACQFFYTRKVM